MIYKTESVYVTIDKVVRDLDLGANEVPEYDMIEWCMDALEHIGAYSQLTMKSCNLAVMDYKATLPCDLHQVHSFIKAASVTLNSDYRFYAGTYQQALADAGQDWSEMPPYEKYKDLLLGITRTSDYFDNSHGSRKLERNSNMFSVNDSWTASDYVVNHNTVSTAFKEGVIYLKYLAFPVDENGYPEVPANVSYRDALFWKCAYHLSMRNPQAIKNPRMQDMEYCKQKWDFYCTQARAEANMRDLEGMIRIKNNMFRLINTVDDDVNDFRNLGRPQRFLANGRN